MALKAPVLVCPSGSVAMVTLGAVSVGTFSTLYCKQTIN